MDKSAIRNFAVWARVNLIENVSQKAFEYGIEKGGELQLGVTTVSGRVLSQQEVSARNQLITRIKEIGYEEVIEEVAYTWFNRFTALRFMEVNEYLPTHVRVFSDENGDFNPDILKEALTIELEGLNRQKVIECIENQNNEELYKYLLVCQCNALSNVLSPLFTKLESYVELLLPNNLLRTDSVLYKMVKEIPEQDWTEQVEIIGWLYQFYVSDNRQEFRDAKVVTRELIPTLTQVFTPDWIVRYMAENSLGRLWLESYPYSTIKSELKYYVEDAKQEPDVQRKINEIKYKNVNPEDIKVIEPCCGSGHVLAYIFDLLYKMYEEKGYQQREIPTLILSKNIFGLEIDKRAAQLASFSLVMKARKLNGRFFSERYYVKPSIIEIVDSGVLNSIEYKEQFKELRIFNYEEIDALEDLVETFRNAKTIGSLLIMPKIKIDLIESAIDKLENKVERNIFNANFVNDSIKILKKLVAQYKIMADKYDVMITNPPYLGISKMEASPKKYLTDNYPNSKSDMFAMFMEVPFVKDNGFRAIVNPDSWMFLVSYEDLRKKIIHNESIVNMIHLGLGAFDAVVQTTSFVMRNAPIAGNGVYFRLVDEKDKESAFLSGGGYNN